FRFPRIVMTECVNHSSPSSGCFKHQLIYPRRLLPSIDLCYSSDTHESIRVTFQHEFLERAHLFQVAFLCCPKDSVSQVTNSPMSFFPINGIPIGLRLGSVC